jgi:hypothetical protein
MPIGSRYKRCREITTPALTGFGGAGENSLRRLAARILFVHFWRVNRASAIRRYDEVTVAVTTSRLAPAAVLVDCAGIASKMRGGAGIVVEMDSRMEQRSER